jgi:hypothetical protein
VIDVCPSWTDLDWRGDYLMTTPPSDPRYRGLGDKPAVRAILKLFDYSPIHTSSEIIPVVAAVEGSTEPRLDDRTRSLLRLMVRAGMLRAVERVPICMVRLDREPVYRFRDEFVAEVREIRDARLYSKLDDEDFESFSARLTHRFDPGARCRPMTVFVKADTLEAVPLLEAERDSFNARPCDDETVRRHIGQSFALTRLHVARTVITPGHARPDLETPSYLSRLEFNVNDDPLAPHAFYLRLPEVPDVVDTCERLQSGMAVYFGGCRDKSELEELHEHFLENYLSNLCPGYVLW